MEKQRPRTTWHPATFCSPAATNPRASSEGDSSAGPSTQRLGTKLCSLLLVWESRKHHRLMCLRCDQAWPWQITGLCKYCVRLSHSGSPCSPQTQLHPLGSGAEPKRGSTSGPSLSSCPDFPASVASQGPSTPGNPTEWLVLVLGKGWNIISLWKMFLLYLQVQDRYVLQIEGTRYSPRAFL